MKSTESKNLRFILYCRKSTDSEDRQIQSIEDQKNELERIVKRDGLNVVKVFTESMSAKKPGRPKFSEMMKMIQDREADGILCWKLNRLARNPVDGGSIQWLLQQGVIKSIVTPSKEYLPTDNVLMMAVELGMANQFILDLSKDVTRGLNSKVEKGWRPGRAPIGYLNDKAGEKGAKQIFKDPERFPIVRKMWDLLLTGSYTIPEILKKASNEWGLRTREELRKPSKTLCVSNIYKIFTNPFYYGEFNWKGEMLSGKHQPMITPDEYDRAQRILGKKGKPRPKNKRLPFNGVITCGGCGGMITSEEKFKTIKSTGEVRSYLYHHCTRRKKDISCDQKGIRHEVLKEQIEQYLDSITIPEEFLNFALEVLRSNNKIEETSRNAILENHQRNYQSCLKRVDNLINLYISPENIDRELLNDTEYKEQKNALMKEKTSIESEIRNIETRVDDWVELTEKTFHFATYAKHWFEKGDYEVKTQILSALGQNFTFTNGKLAILLQEPLLIIKNGLENPVLQKARLEPMKMFVNTNQNSPFGAASYTLSG